MIRRIAAVIGLAWIAAFGAPSSAEAHHTITNCNNDPGNIDEVFVGAHNVAFVGVDTGISGSPTNETVVVCVIVLSSDTRVFVDHYDPPTTGTGQAVRVTLCTATCTTPVQQTGADVKVATPLFSCVWINGAQQNPGCSP